MNEYDELLAENFALTEMLGKTLDALEGAIRRERKLGPREPLNDPPGSIIGDARRLLGRVK